MLLAHSTSPLCLELVEAPLNSGPAGNQNSRTVLLSEHSTEELKEVSLRSKDVSTYEPPLMRSRFVAHIFRIIDFLDRVQGLVGMGDFALGERRISSGRILGRPRLSHSKEPIIITAPLKCTLCLPNCEYACKKFNQHENTRTSLFDGRGHKRSRAACFNKAPPKRRGRPAARLQNRT